LVLILFLFQACTNGTKQEAKEHQGGWFFKSSTTLTSKNIPNINQYVC